MPRLRYVAVLKRYPKYYYHSWEYIRSKRGKVKKIRLYHHGETIGVNLPNWPKYRYTSAFPEEVEFKSVFFPYQWERRFCRFVKSSCSDIRWFFKELGWQYSNFCYNVRSGFRLAWKRTCIIFKTKKHDCN